MRATDPQFAVGRRPEQVRSARSQHEGDLPPRRRRQPSWGRRRLATVLGATTAYVAGRFAYTGGARTSFHAGGAMRRATYRAGDGEFCVRQSSGALDDHLSSTSASVWRWVRPSAATYRPLVLGHLATVEMATLSLTSFRSTEA